MALETEWQVCVEEVLSGHHPGRGVSLCRGGLLGCPPIRGAPSKRFRSAWVSTLATRSPSVLLSLLFARLLRLGFRCPPIR